MKLLKPKSNRGYTLIELLTTAVASGLLAASAVPVLLNLQNEARNVAFKSIENSIINAAHMANAQQRLSGLGKNDAIIVEGKKIAMLNGFPTQQGMAQLVKQSNFSFENSNSAFIWSKANTKLCGKQYIPAKEGKNGTTIQPSVKTLETDCN